MIWKITRRKHNVVFVFGKQAKVLREMLDSAVVPDRTALEKEADEFEQQMLKKREETLARGEKWQCESTICNKYNKNKLKYVKNVLISDEQMKF